MQAHVSIHLACAVPLEGQDTQRTQRGPSSADTVCAQELPSVFPSLADSDSEEDIRPFLLSSEDTALSTWQQLSSQLPSASPEPDLAVYGQSLALPPGADMLCSGALTVILQADPPGAASTLLCCPPPSRQGCVLPWPAHAGTEHGTGFSAGSPRDISSPSSTIIANGQTAVASDSPGSFEIAAGHANSRCPIPYDSSAAAGTDAPQLMGLDSLAGLDLQGLLQRLTSRPRDAGNQTALR